MKGKAKICGVAHAGGRNGELLACGMPMGHTGEHAWTTLPSFFEGLTKTEKAVKRLLDNFGEFGTITDNVYMDDLIKAFDADMAECKSRTDTTFEQ